MDDLSGIVDDLRKKYCGLSGEVCYNERRQWALREYCRKENRMNQVNYQKELEKILNTLQEKGEAASDYRPPRLFLHSCCAPCSSYCLEYLCRYFLITVFYYNPNIYPESEYTKRILEQQKLISEMHFKNSVSFLAGSYDKEQFYEMAKGLEEVKEGGERCMKCYEMRLKKTAQKAAEGGFDFFTTTLSISPMKNAQKLNEIGRSVGAEYGMEYLLSDFKKKNGYKRSIELSAIYGLYRQDYCGCEFSYKARKSQTEK